MVALDRQERPIDAGAVTSSDCPFCPGSDKSTTHPRRMGEWAACNPLSVDETEERLRNAFEVVRRDEKDGQAGS
jgi:galactose-1-phosphate uridylyltransferase